MPKVTKPLTVKQIKAIKCELDKDGNPRTTDTLAGGDGCDGLTYQLKPTGWHCWFLRYNSPVHNYEEGKQKGNPRRRRYTFEGHDRDTDKSGDISLVEAREIARRVRARVARGEDPLDVRKQLEAENKLDQSKRITFRERADYWALHVRAPDFKHGIDDDQYTRLKGHLTNHIYPKIGDLMLADVKLDQVLSVVLPYNQNQYDLATRLRQIIWRVLQHAINHELISFPNYADLDLLKEDLGKGQRKKITKRRPSLDYEKVPEFFDYIWNEDWEYRPHVACLAFTILTNPRSGVATRLDWKAIDLQKKIWTIKTGEGKTYTEYEVVLSDRAIEVLKSQRSYQQRKGLVFRSATKGIEINTGTVLDVIKEYAKDKGTKATTHGFRRSFTNFFAEEHGTSFSYTARKLCMQQAPGSKEEVAYNSTQVVAERTQMMKIWADWCVDGTKTKPSNVTSISKAKKAKSSAKKRRASQ
jgi:integrase